MDATRFDTELASAMGDAAGSYYPPELRMTAARRAVHAYSQYRPLLKRYGTGFVWLPAAAGSTNVALLGGTFAIGDRLLLEPGTPSSEIITVQSLAPAPPSPSSVATTLNLTLKSPLLLPHNAGAFVTRQTPGLSLTPGIDTYALPLDWIHPEQQTLDLALGMKASVSRTASYYDASYTLSQRYASAGAGRALDYSGAARNYAFNPNGGMNVGASGQQLWRFRAGAFPMLVIVPAPTQAQTLDFDYYGQHLMETVPDEAFEPVLAYARHACFEGRAAWLGAQNDYAEGDVKEDFSKSVAQLRVLSQEAKQEFDEKVRHATYATSG